MSKIMIYAQKGAVGGSVENVWGYEMQVCTIDPSNEKAVAAAKANGYSKSPHDVIELIHAKAMESENNAMKSVLADNQDKDRINELESQLTTALEEIAGFEAKIAKLTDWNEHMTEQNELQREDIKALNSTLDETVKPAEDSIREIADLKAKLAIYEETPVLDEEIGLDYDDMEKSELKALLDERGVKYVARDNLDDLIKKAKDSE